ncbi:histidine kinase [Glycomyces sp. NPDC046736]|uniref:sensor histidine kinase n=1 Tax=Glycomyces sp. NPDC046736 TaxID=3155615 RepID=UPI0033F106E1
MTEPRSPRRAEIAGMAAGAGLLTGLSLAARPELGPLDYAVAVLALAAAMGQLWRPVSGALAAAVLAVLSPVATPAATIGALQTAWRRRFTAALTVAAVGIGVHLLQWIWYPNPSLTFGWWALLVSVAYGGLVGWGALARSRQLLLISLRERARRAEAEQGRRVAEARAAERRGLAREMHDVLANRLSLVATHAGALEFRPDAPPEKVALAAGVVRDGVHRALEELREVITLLREDDEAATAGPPPSRDDLHALLADTRATGREVLLCGDFPESPLPPSLGRNAYRVLQEGLTNARKHAAGPVEVTVTGEPGADLVIELSNALPEPGTAGTIPGAGLGLVGLTERVRLAGGELDHERAEGRFRLRARLPWPL